MNIDTTATIAQLSLPMAARADSSVSLVSGSMQVDGGAQNANNSSQGGSGSSFDSVLSSVVTRSASNHLTTGAATTTPAQAGQGQPIHSATTTMGVSSRKDALSQDQTAAKQEHKSEGSKEKSATQKPSADQTSISLAPIINPAALPLPVVVPNSNSASVNGKGIGAKAASGQLVVNAEACSGPGQDAGKSSGTRMKPSPSTATVSSAQSVVPTTIPGTPESTIAAGSRAVTSNNSSATTLPSSTSMKTSLQLSTTDPALQNVAAAQVQRVGQSVAAGAPQQVSTGSAGAVVAKFGVGQSGLASTAGSAGEVVMPVAASTSTANDGLVVSTDASLSPANTEANRGSSVSGLTTSIDQVVNSLASSTFSQWNQPGDLIRPTSSSEIANQPVIGNATGWWNNPSGDSVVVASVDQQVTLHSGGRKAGSGGNATSNLISSAGQQNSSSSVSAPTLLGGTSHPNLTSTDSVSITSQLSDAVMQRVHSSTTGDQASVVLRLNPPELGKVSVHVSMTNDIVSVRLVTSDDAARQIIDRQMNDLRQSLTNQGISLNQCHVECNAGNQQSFHQNTAQRSFDEPSSSGVAARRIATVVRPASIPQVWSRSQLNYVA